MAPRIVAGIIGVFFALQTLNWIAQPKAAAESLGMPLLDGIGRSTQVGDQTAFFFALSTMVLLGAVRSNGQWLQGGALLLISAAVMRTLAWAVHGAAFAAPFIAIEVVFGGLLLFLSTKLDAEATS